MMGIPPEVTEAGNYPYQELSTVSTAGAGGIVGAKFSAQELMVAMDLIIKGVENFADVMKTATENLRHGDAATGQGMGGAGP
jgi:hypothetical protein